MSYWVFRLEEISADYATVGAIYIPVILLDYLSSPLVVSPLQPVPWQTGMSMMNGMKIIFQKQESKQSPIFNYGCSMRNLFECAVLEKRSNF